MAATKEEIRRRVIRAVVFVAIAAAVVAIEYFLLDSGAYLWMKALHIVAVISWMAGMLYLPRLFVYHSRTEVGSEMSETFKVMERRLLRAIINPAMVVAWAAGLWIALQMGYFHDAWFHLKLTCVLLMSGVHGLLAKAVADFARDERRHGHVFWRAVNEVPTVLMIAIVILVVVKPF
jgi:putative membrane protein